SLEPRRRVGRHPASGAVGARRPHRGARPAGRVRGRRGDPHRDLGQVPPRPAERGARRLGARDPLLVDRPHGGLWRGPRLAPLEFALMQRYTVTTLDGGERIVTEPVSSVRSVAIGIWIGAGSRDETSGQEGVSHLLEHLLFKGSARYSAMEIAQIFDGLGGELNAATSREYTVIYARVLDAHLETALDVMADMVLQPRFDADEMSSERDVVLEEIAMYDDTPQDLVHDLIAQAVFGDHPLGRPVIGTGEVVSAATTTDVRAYHDARYVSPNIVVAAAGNLDHEPLAHAV